MSTHQKRSDYRPEIDGLRALAVLPVLVYHLASGGSKWQLLPGGFLGVDVFFVISGYLITRILVGHRERPMLESLRLFWGGRLRRIFPLLATVTFATTVASWFLLAPKAMREYLGSAVAALLSFSNLYFWGEDSYVAEASAVKPLMHTWSLAVEEQFYLLYPILLLLILHYLRRPVIAIWVLLLLSLNACIIAGAIDSSFNFFSFTSRGWELAAGAIVALTPKRNSGRLAWLGLAMIGIGYLVVKDTYWHPSPTWTLLPVIGTVLVIRYSAPENSAGRLLAWRPLVAIGLISFGIYLWHWPIMAFVNYSQLGGGLAVRTFEILAPLVLATASYFLIEKPFRNRERMPRARFAVSLASMATASALLLAFTSVNAATPLRLGTQLASTYQSFERSDLSAICGAADDVALFEKGLCRIGSAEAKPDFVVFGDSHALSLLDAFDQRAAAAGRSGYFAYQSGCLPALGVYVERKPEQTERCHQLNLRIADRLKAGGIDTLFLTARWSYYFSDPNSLRLATTPRGFGKSNRPLLVSALRETLNTYSPLVRKIVIIEDTPALSVKPEIAFKLKQPLEAFAVNRSAYVKRNAEFRAVLAEVGAPANLDLFDPTPYLCGPKLCPIGKGHQSYYFDDDHLSVLGAARLNQPLSQLLARQ